jgi:predicted DCC family thiol-disulfide oxidoreductase YuxK
MSRRPVLLYDGDCGFCGRSARLAERMGTSAEVTAWQAADLAALGTTAERADYELLWVAADGRVSGGAQAVARLLSDLGGVWKVPGALLRIPPFSWLGHGLYRLVANNRNRLPGGTPACVLPAPERPQPRPQVGEPPARE